MFHKIQIIKKQIIYIILILSIIVLNLSVVKKTNASNYNIENIIISENFSKNFKKEEVFDKAFEAAFDQLILTLLNSSDKKKIQNMSLYTIKRLIDSFVIKNESFVNNNYSANFTVNFNKVNTLNYFEKNNIFPSIPKKIDLLFIPVLIDKNKSGIEFFNNNQIYKNWNNRINNHNLINYILPTDEIEDRGIIIKNFSNIESFNFKEIINKYNISNNIILIINESNQKIQILSKININNNFEIVNFTFENLDLNNKNDLNKIIDNLKIKFEDIWKSYNIINTSIKLPLSISIDSKEYQRIKTFEKFLDSFDLVSSSKISMFDNKYISYKLIFNGSPKTFFDEANKYGFFFIKENQNWIIK
ncbi:MAG: hypothetical protein ACJZ4G_03560 [Candidatus Pelagibacter sp.]